MSPEQSPEPLHRNLGRTLASARKGPRMTTPTEALIIGIDVAKDKLDLARSDQPAIVTCANNDADIATLVQRLAQDQPTMIVVEATGGYERPLVAALLEAELPIAVANPRHVRHLAKGLGLLAKTDAIDARVLVAYGRHAEPRLAEKREKNRIELEALVTCRRQLMLVSTEQRNRRQVTHSANARKAIDAVLKTLQRQIDTLDEQIRKLIDSDDDLHRKDCIIRSVPGAGPILSATLLASLCELGQLDRGPISALVGVAPFNHDSGRSKRKRVIRGGRASVRSVLYMAALAAIRCNPVIRAFAQRLRAAGKVAKVVIVACMRKLTTILNAMLRDDLQWNQLNLVKNA